MLLTIIIALPPLYWSVQRRRILRGSSTLRKVVEKYGL